jgi:hypothetical protein
MDKRKEAHMDRRAVVAAKLAELGVTVNDDDLDELTTAYATILKWQGIVDALLDRNNEPAVTFAAKTEALS